MSHDETNLDIDSGLGKKTLSGYLKGFILSLIFTVLAFWIVGVRAFSEAGMIAAIMILAVAQLIVQVIFFLRLNGQGEGKWNMMSFLFTIFVAFVLIGGSIWIMWNLNYNMMH